MSTQEQRERLAQLLESVAAGRVSASEALSETEKWTDVPWKERLIDHAWHVLGHYDEDTDIRERNPSYAESSRKGLQKYAEQLRRPVRKGLWGWAERLRWLP
jgi:hypothetical protein